MKKLFAIIIVALSLTACGNQIPATYAESEESPAIYPDYTGVTVPINIAGDYLRRYKGTTGLR